MRELSWFKLGLGAGIGMITYYLANKYIDWESEVENGKNKERK